MNAWMADAACRGMDPAIFHPPTAPEAEPALRVCASCTVRAECLDFGSSTAEPQGVWGGEVFGLPRRSYRRRQKRQLSQLEQIAASSARALEQRRAAS